MPNVDVVEIAQRLADDVLFPVAAATDRAPVVPLPLLDALAGAGLYGLVGPASAGGLDVDPAVVPDVLERLASGCLTTTFVWAQHHTPVRSVAASPSAAVRDEWLAPLCQGRRRAGVAFAGLRRPGPPLLTAAPVEDGWVLDGMAPWVTGWGRIDVVLTAARSGPDVVWALVDAAPSPSLVATPLALAAVNASATVALRYHSVFVPASRVTVVEPFEEWRVRDAAGLRTNGALSLGVARRCCALLGPSPFDEELAACRAALAAVPTAEVPKARAAASDLALRAATALVVSGGGRSMLADAHAQRLAREALFLQVFGQTASIRAAQQSLHRAFAT